MGAINDKCRSVDRIDYGGQQVSVGDLISYDAHEWIRLESIIPRRESVVLELWHEDWWGDPAGLHYAELENGDRAWFHRDHVGTPGELGAIPEAALF